MYRLLILSALIVGIVLNVFGQTVSSRSDENSKSDEFSIYEAFLKHWTGGNTNGANVIYNTTVQDDGSDAQDTRPLFSFLKKKLSGLKMETVADYKLRNRTPATLIDPFDNTYPVRLISTAEIKELRGKVKGDPYGDEFIKLFEQKYGSDTLISISRVGFSKDQSQALMSYGSTCGATCGEGHFILLVKKKSKWIITKEIRSWIA